ncbi:MAG: alpha/beta fold hydrolase [Myxococcota bacterium]|nr:alpha/beta fold hydrolase [Myxococcota bacterium]
MTGCLVDLGGYSLAVKDRGAGPAVLFGHSLTFDSAMFDRVADQLSERFRVVQVDLPGHGGSGTPKEVFSLEEVADDLPGLLDGLGIERAAWVGHSMGGMVGMRFALQHPKRVGALALLNTSAEAEIPNMRDLYHHVNESSRGKPSTKPTVEFVLSLMFSEAFREQHPDRVEPYRTLLYEPSDAEGVYRMARSVIWRDSVLESLGGLDTPCLVITAALDTAVPAHFGESIARSVPGCRRLQLDDCGHLSPEERPEEVAAAIHSFLEEAWT